jgi:periplasmic copper chaperone A
MTNASVTAWRGWGTALGVLLVAAAMLAPGRAIGHELRAGNLVIVHTWVRATPPGATVTAGYGKITNIGTDADRLMSASLSGAYSGEVHSTTVRDGIVKMAPLRDGVPIAAGQTVELKPASLHIMFTGLTSSLEGDTYVDGTLTFQKAGKIAVEFFVEPLGRIAPSHNHKGGAPQ